MRAVLVISLVMSFSAFSQTRMRVKENIKQSSVSSEYSETEKSVKKPRKSNSSKRVRSEKTE